MSTRLILALALTACGGGEPITLVTYNGGLAPGFVDGAVSRAPMVADAVAALDADVVCLQEIWTPEHVQLLKDTTSEAFPHQVWAEGTQSTLPEPGCTTEELDRLVGCVERTCADVCDEYVDDCMLDNCAISFINVSESCQGCVMANVGGDIPEVRAACSTSYPEYAYDGAFGTALLSKHEIVSSAHLELSATTNRRGVHHAVIDSPAGQVDVYCTHMTAVFTLLPYPREEGDWDVEQRAQADAIVAYVGDSAETSRVVVLGDTNSGPAVGDSIPEYEIGTYSKFTAAGWANPYVDLVGECTYCGDNPLIGGGADRLIDHVFTEGFGGEPAASRLLDESVSIEVCGETAQATVSDHYAVSVTIAP